MTKHFSLKTTKSSYEVWRNLKQRCLNPKRKDYSDYGGRGITVSVDWMTFEGFYRDMGERPMGMQLDRINNDKGYCKENCRWVTPGDNLLNRRNRAGKKLNLPKGVSKNGSRYTARIQINQFTYHVGSFSSPQEAHFAFCKIFFEWYGKNTTQELE